jgi:hypothetical protein
VIVIFVIFELLFYFHFNNIRDKRIELEKPKPEFKNGKRVYVYTFPGGVEGGIFAKTYVDIDDQCTLRIKTLLVTPKDL